MTLDDIITIVDGAYPDGLVGRCFREPNEDHGDTLTKFIAVELRETFDPVASDKEQLVEALRALTAGANQLEEARHALDSRLRDLERGHSSTTTFPRR